MVAKIPCQINQILCVQEIYFCYVKPFRFHVLSLPLASINFNSYTATSLGLFKYFNDKADSAHILDAKMLKIQTNHNLHLYNSPS